MGIEQLVNGIGGSATPVIREELRSLSRERDAEILAAGLVQLGERAIQRRDFQSAGVIFQYLSDPPAEAGPLPMAYRDRARHALAAMRGEGSFGSRFEFTSRQFVHELTNPSTLVAMTGAQALFGVTRMALWSRLAASPGANLLTRVAGAELISGLGAFALEAPAFVGIHRGWNAAFGNSSAGESPALAREIGSTYLMLGALRSFGWAGRQAFNRLHGVDAFGRTTRLTGVSGLSAKLFPQAAMLGGIYLSQRLENRPGHSSFADSLLTLLQFNITGEMASRMLGPRWAVMQSRLEPPRRPIRLSLFPEAVTAEGIRIRIPEDPYAEARANHSLMMAGDPGDNSSGKPRSGIPPRAPSPSHAGESRLLRMQVERMIENILPEYFENLDRLPSDHFPLDARERAFIDRQIREYLDEAGLKKFPPGDASVERQKSQIWERALSGNPDGPRLVSELYSEIEAAQSRLNQVEFADGTRYVPSTLKWSRELSRLMDRSVFFFDDTTRITGSFKERGAIVQALRARDDGVMHLVTASHGNHGLAVALAANRLGMRSTIVLPHTTPLVKIEALKNLGATVITTHEQPWRGYEESRDWGLRYTFERNFILERTLDLTEIVRYIHGFEDVIPGQGVAGLEIVEQINSLPAEMPRRFRNATFLVPMGGGGLAAGVATAVKRHFPESRIIGVASDQAPALHSSLINGERAEIFVNEKGLCDSGIGLSIPGKRPFGILREVLDASMTVSDPRVGEAMRLLHRYEGMTVEGSAATGLAALLDPRFPALSPDPKTPIVLYLSGRNIDPPRHAAVMEGREAFLPGGVLHGEKP